MDRLIMGTSIFIKSKLKLCNIKGCYRKAVEDIVLE